MTSVAGDSGIPGIRVIEEIARGGMATVSKVEQEHPRRIVAMKTLQTQWVGHGILSERFRREAQVMAALEHPGILPIYEVGEWDGLPWFTMKLADGGSLATQVSEFSGKWREIARLIAGVAEALHFAHERGVLHRDVKPGNILFDAAGAVYLADFGLAKQLESLAGEAALTLEASVLGTPSFIAPELASGATCEATTLSDVYSLAAVLYELLAGRPPYENEHLPTLLQRIANESPASLAGIRPTPPLDLRLICEKGMSREPRLRYATAREMREDLQRFSEGMPVLARPVSRLENAWFWCRRHPAMASMLALLASLILGFSLFMTLAFLKVEQSYEETAQAQKSAESHLLESKLAEAAGIRLSRQPNFRERALDLVRAASKPDESREMRFSRRSEMVAALAYPKVKLILPKLTSRQRDVTLPPVISPPTTPITLPPEAILDDTRFFLKELPQQFAQPIQAMVWSPQQKWLALAEKNGATHVWDAHKKGMLHVLGGTATQASHLAFSADERLLLTLSEPQRLTIFDLISGLPVVRLDVTPPRGPKPLTWKNQKIRPVTYADQDCEIEITPGAYTSSRVPHFTSFPLGFSLSPDADSLVAAGATSIMKWELGTTDEPQALHDATATALAFSPDGRWLFSVGVEGLQQWKVENSRPIPESRETLLPPFQKTITALVVADGLAAVAGPDGVELWDLTLRKRLLEQTSAASAIALSSDGKHLSICRSNYEIWDTQSGRKITLLMPSLAIQQAESHCAYSPNGRWLATGHASGRILLWRVRDGEKICTLESPSLEAVGHFTFSPDSAKLSSVCRNGMVEFWDLKSLSEELEKMNLGWD